jgi:hypothetical protein
LSLAPWADLLNQYPHEQSRISDAPPAGHRRTTCVPVRVRFYVVTTTRDASCWLTVSVLP